MKQLLSILFFILYMMVPKIALAVATNPCADVFSTPSKVNIVDMILGRKANNESITPQDMNAIRIDLLADQYERFSEKKKSQFKQTVEQMEFTQEDIILMLKNESFVNDVILKTGFHKTNDKWTNLYGLAVLKDHLGLSNSQIIELASMNLNDKKSELWNLLNGHDTREKKQSLESLGFSKQETFEFLLTHLKLSGGGPTPYDWVPEAKKLSQFKQIAEQMGFTQEDVILMLTTNEFFAHNFNLLKKEAAFGLTALKDLGLSNSQIIDLANMNLNNKKDELVNLWRLTSSSIRETKKFLESIGFSKEETFEFLVTKLRGKSPTPFRLNIYDLEFGVTKLSELGLDYSDIRKILLASSAADVEINTGIHIIKENKITLEQKRDVLRQAGLTEEAINLIPEDMLMVTPRERILNASTMAISIAFWSGVLYYFLN